MSEAEGLSLCIINYNGRKFLQDTLTSAIQFQSLFDEIIFVDNGSTDDSVSFVETHFPNVRIVQLDKNYGAAGARNAGIDAARSRYLLFLDNDVLLTDQCTERLLENLKLNTGAVIAAPCVRYRHQPDTVQFCGADNHFLGLMKLHDEDLPVATIDLATWPTDSVVTASFLIDRSKLTADNRFDETYFYQMEDHDFGVRQRINGMSILAVPNAQVLHGEGAEGMSIRRSGQYSTARIRGLIRNRWIFLLKFYRWRTLIVLSPILVLYELAQLVIVLKKGWTKEWRQSVHWIFTNWRLLMAKRAEIQRTRLIKDRDYMTGGPIPHRRELTASRAEVLLRNLLDGICRGYWALAKSII